MRGLALIALLAAGAAVAPAGASAAAPARIAAYCSPSGDLCFGIMNRSGAVHLEIDTVARYFSRYRLCVRAPSGLTTCRSFPLRPRGALWGSSVRWYRNFPNGGPGVYRVTWKLGSNPLGPTLRFRLPLG